MYAYINSFHLSRSIDHPSEPGGQFIPIRNDLGSGVVFIGLAGREMTSSCKRPMLLRIRSISLEIRYRFREHIVGRLRVGLGLMRLDSSYKSSAKF